MDDLLNTCGNDTKEPVQSEVYNVIEQFQDCEFFVWKHPAEKISMDMVLKVPAECVACCIEENGTVYDFKAGTYQLSGEQYPLALCCDASDGVSCFSCDFYFVRMDRRYSFLLRNEGLQITPEVQARCHCAVQVCDPKKLIQNLAVKHKKSAAKDGEALLEKFRRDMDCMFSYAVDSVYTDLPLSCRETSMLRKGVLQTFPKLLDSYGLKLVEFGGLDIRFHQSAYDWYLNAGSSGADELACKIDDYTSHQKRIDAWEKQEAQTMPPSAQGKKRRFGMLAAAIGGAAASVGTAVDRIRGAVRNTANAGKTHQPEIKKIQISAIAPGKFRKGDYNMVHVILYEEDFRKIVDALKSPGDLEEREMIKVPDDARIRVRLTSPDVEIQENDQEAQWYGEYLTFGFGVFMPVDYAKRSILFHAKVYINGVIASNLTFTAQCVSGYQQRLEIRRRDVMRAFASYASEDRDEVIRVIQGMRKARQDLDVFLDVEGLRSGEHWEERLYHEIDSSDILYLCWSRSAKDSKWVDREWRYAFQQKGTAGVEPVPLEPSEICPPPPELDRKHFNDNLNYMKKNRNWQ